MKFFETKIEKKIPHNIISLAELFFVCFFIPGTHRIHSKCTHQNVKTIKMSDFVI
jgi:hypothetical protein